MILSYKFKENNQSYLMEVANLKDELIYNELHSRLLQLKREYRDNIRNSDDFQNSTLTFMTKVKEIQNEYLLFVHEYLRKEHSFLEISDYLIHVENIFGL